MDLYSIFHISFVKGIVMSEKLLSALDWIPGMESVKLINFGTSAFRGILMKWHDKVSFFRQG